MNLNPESIPISTSKHGPRDVFLQLLAIITLYFSAGSFIALIFQIINLEFPDPLQINDYYNYAIQGSRSIIRFAIASLVVIFPVYIFTTRYLIRDHEKNPEKRNLRSRRWLLNLTLFIAALFIIGDLVAILYQFLGGELTIRFALKMLTILFVASTIFYYYHWGINRFKTG